MATLTKVFISYGRSDGREFAIRLRDDLIALDFSVWLDLEEIQGGATWSTDIEDAIDHCDVGIALMTHSSFSSKWCRAEQLRLQRKGKRIIPLLLQDDAEIPLTLEHLNYLNFSDISRYDEMFRDLLSDISAGQAFRSRTPTGSLSPETIDKSPFKPSKRSSGSRTYTDEKRNASAFRREIAKLRSENWLGARYWWTYFLFYFTDIHQVVQMLEDETILSPHEAGQDFHSRWDKFVRLYFRPRTPGLFRSEGFRPTERTHDNYCPIPVYLLFDFEAVICHPDSRFSEGDPTRTKKTYKTPSYFRDLPFDLIYHDSWFMPDERDEIMRSREAQVIVPDQMGLESLQFIWVRSTAEYETLQSLMRGDVWRKWRDKITTRTDFQLFNQKWVYVDDVHMSESEIRFRFNPCTKSEDAGPYHLQLTIMKEESIVYQWDNDSFKFDSNDLMLMLPEAQREYHVTLQIDGELAYSGSHQPQLILM